MAEAMNKNTDVQISWQVDATLLEVILEIAMEP